ncbi:PAS domain S-box protein [Candidatus Bathyarchaeota archaeon]|nr:PAS domain S-box protein [Candidatus Bathyarchaeota archaeon]
MPRSVIVEPSDEIRILHVDDDVNQSEFLQYFLPEMDKAFKIDFISDPCQVMEKMGSEIYDCVVTDYQMPKMNGIELAEKIRESFDLPIIIYTGQGSEEIAEAAFSAGIDDYLRKEMDPSHYQVLSKRIRNVVDKKRLDIMYKTIIEETNESIIISVGNKIEFANNAAMDLFGIEDVSDLVADQYRFLRNKEPNRNILGNDKISSEDSDHILSKYHIHSKDGRDVIVDASSGPITYNGKNGLITFLRDVTENEQLEKEKRESQERFKALFELAPDGIMTFDLRGIITSINPAFERLTGYSSEDFVGKHFLSMKTLPKTDLKNFVSVFSSMVKGNIPPPFEFKYLRSDGTMSWGESHIALITISGKREFLIIARDISERKKRKVKISDEQDYEYPSEELDNELLISVGQLGYLLSEQVLANIKDADEKIKYYFGNSEEYDESVQEVNNILSQTLVLLDEYKKISEGTVLMPNKNVLDIIMEMVNQIHKPENLKIYVNKTGDEILVTFDVDMLNRVLPALLNEIITMDDITEIDVIINVKKYFMEIEVKNIYDTDNRNLTKNIISKLIKNPEVVLINEFIHDYGGEILLTFESSSIIIKIPTYKREIQSDKILEKINNNNYLRRLI